MLGIKSNVSFSRTPLNWHKYVLGVTHWCACVAASQRFADLPEREGKWGKSLSTSLPPSPALSALLLILASSLRPLSLRRPNGTKGWRKRVPASPSQSPRKRPALDGEEGDNQDRLIRGACGVSQQKDERGTKSSGEETKRWRKKKTDRSCLKKSPPEGNKHVLTS